MVFDPRTLVSALFKGFDTAKLVRDVINGISSRLSVRDFKAFGTVMAPVMTSVMSKATGFDFANLGKILSGKLVGAGLTSPTSPLGTNAVHASISALLSKLTDPGAGGLLGLLQKGMKGFGLNMPGPEAKKPESLLAGLGNKASAGMTKLSSWFEGMADTLSNPEKLKEWGKNLESLGSRKASLAGKLVGAAGHGASAVQEGAAGNELESGAELARGAGKLVGMIPGIGKAGEAIINMGATTLSVTGKFERLNQSVHLMNMRFAEFSTSMAQVQAEQKIRDIDLDRARGNELAKSARSQAEASHRLKETTAPAKNALSKLWNSITEFDAKITAKVWQFFGAPKPNSEKQEPEKNKDREINGGEWFFRTAEENWSKHYGRPNRFGERPWGDKDA